MRARVPALVGPPERSDAGYFQTMVSVDGSGPSTRGTCAVTPVAQSSSAQAMPVRIFWTTKALAYWHTAFVGEKGINLSLHSRAMRETPPNKNLEQGLLSSRNHR